MRIEQLRYLIEVAYSGSFTKAAEKLHVSQPNISHAITLFEKELGANIFRRVRSGIEPTEVGRSVIEKAHTVLDLIDDLMGTAKTHSSSIREKLIIGSISGICTSFLPKTLSSYKAKYPNVDIEIKEDNSGAIEEGVLEGSLDLGLVGIPEEYEFKYLSAQKFLVCKMMACVGINSPLANKEQVSFYDIIQYPIIRTSEHMREELKKYGEPTELFYSSRTESSKRVIAEGLATSFYMDISLKIDPYVSTGQIIPIPIKENPKVDLYWIRHLKTEQSAASEAFIKELLLQVSYYLRWKSL